MSYFVGIAFDDQTRDAFARAVALARPHADAKWELPEKAHLTLVFHGETRPDEALIREVAGRHAAFSLTLKGGGEFGARVLWLGTGSPALTALQADLAKVLPVGDEHGAYTPHVTIARAKRRGPLTAAVAALKDFESAPFAVKRVTLFESHQAEFGLERSGRPVNDASRNVEYRELMHVELR